MGCGCNSGNTKSVHIVTGPDGQTFEVDGETAARIKATQIGGTFKKK